MFVIARVADEAAFDEGDVQNGSVEIDELENEHLERQVVVKLRLSSMHFWKKKHLQFNHVNSTVVIVPKTAWSICLPQVVNLRASFS